MIQDFLKTDIAIITTEPVEKTFNNEDAYLHCVIKVVGDNEVDKIRTYKVRTDLVAYKDARVFLLDKQGEVVFKDNGEPETETKKQLTWLEQKQDWALQTFTYQQIDTFIEMIASSIPKNLTRTQRDIFELQTIFLLKRQEEQPWGIPANKWRIRLESDLIQDK